MSNLVPRPPGSSGRSPFDEIRHVDENPDGSQFEYWTAREAMTLLGYARWENMQNVIRKAMAACRNSGREVSDNFRDVTKVSGRAGPRQRDVQMSRYGMYLVAMNGDPDKYEIAMAQRYFAVQTFRAEQQLPPLIVTPAQPTPTPEVRSWAERFRHTFMPHVCDLHQRHPGCFSVVSAAASQIIFIEDEIVRHLMTTRAWDRPDISIGKRLADFRREMGMPDPQRIAYLYLPDQGMHVAVRVYDGSEWSLYLTWFHDVYLVKHLSYYLDHKPELKAYPQLTRLSAADNSCRSLSGNWSVMPPALRAALTARKGFAPAPPMLPPHS